MPRGQLEREGKKMGDAKSQNTVGPADQILKSVLRVRTVSNWRKKVHLRATAYLGKEQPANRPHRERARRLQVLLSRLRHVSPLLLLAKACLTVHTE
jgi:hypothetical protein